MSDLRTRSAARVPDPDSQGLPLVPPEIRSRYADAMAQIPRVTLSIRPDRRPADLPAVGSFA
jgi:hypothetical protein